MEPAPSPRSKGGKKLNFTMPTPAEAVVAQSAGREKQLQLFKRTKSGLVTPMERLEHAYEEKDAEARLAAQIGQELIEKVKSDQVLIAELKSATLEIRTLYQQMDQLETQMRGLRSNTPDAAQATAADKESAGRLDNIAEVIASLRRGIAAAEASNDRLLQDVRDRDARLQANVSEQREREALRARYTALSEELETTKAELLDARKALSEARTAGPKQSTAGAAKDATAQAEEKHNPLLEAKLAKQREELAEMRGALTAREVQIQQLHHENTKLLEGMAQLTREGHAVRREADELAALLEQTRAECATVKERLEEAELRCASAAAPAYGTLEDSLRAAHQSTSVASSTLSPDSSVASSASSAPQSPAPSTDKILPPPSPRAVPSPISPIALPLAEPTTTEPAPAPTPVPSVRPSAAATPLSPRLRSPRGVVGSTALASPGGGERAVVIDSFTIEEYFFLSATAVKIDLAIKHAEHSDLVFRMDANALYREVQRQQIPFHEWHAFIVVTFLSLLADMIEKRHRDEQQRVFLHRLVRSKNRADVETALKAATKETIEREDGEGRTPLMVAVLERQAEIAHLLLQHGADPNHTDRLRNTPLMLAAEQEDLKIAEILLKGSDLTASNASGCTVAHVLARNSRNAKGAHKLLKMLLQGLPLSEFERKDEHGCTPLFVACTTPAPSLDNIQLLIKGKCSIDPVNRDGRTPLLVAAAVGHAHVVKLLLEAGANAEHRDSTGRSVMQHAKPDSTVAAVVKAFLRERPGGERVLRHLVDEEWQVVPTLNDLPRSQRRLVSDLPDDVLTAHWPLVLNAINFQEKTRFVPNENEAQKTLAHSPKRRQKAQEEMQEASALAVPADDAASGLITPGDPNQLFKHLSREGAGGFGKVFHAHMGSGATKRTVAVKQVKHVSAADQRLNLNEIRVLRKCEHRNVVALIGAYAAPGELWLVMEFMEGGTLAEAAARQALHENHIASILRDVLSGLAYVHSLLVIHRDLKAANVMLSIKGDVKLIDFGIAYQLSEEFNGVRAVCGSPYWMAPEVTRRHFYTTSADIWSLGMVLIEMCDGEPYLNRQAVAAIITCSLDEFPLPQLDEPAHWSDALHAFLKRCLRRNPAERPTAAELQEDPFLKAAASPEEMGQLMRALFMYQGLKDAGFGL